MYKVTKKFNRNKRIYFHLKSKQKHVRNHIRVLSDQQSKIRHLIFREDLFRLLCYVKRKTMETVDYSQQRSDENLT